VGPRASLDVSGGEGSLASSGIRTPDYPVSQRTDYIFQLLLPCILKKKYH